MTGTNAKRHSDNNEIVVSRIGVYCVTCSVTGKSYIGWSAGVHGRLGWHRSHLRNGKHSRREMQRDFIEHGEASFAFEVIAICFDEQFALQLEAELIGESFRAGLSYNGIIPNASDIKPRAKKLPYTPAPVPPARIVSHAEQMKLRYEELTTQHAEESYRDRQLACDVMMYLGFRTKDHFFHLIDSYAKLTGTSEDVLSLEVTGYPKFLLALRRRDEEDFRLSEGKKFHDHILADMQQRDRDYILIEKTARKVWLDAERVAA